MAINRDGTGKTNLDVIGFEYDDLNSLPTRIQVKDKNGYSRWLYLSDNSDILRIYLPGVYHWKGGTIEVASDNVSVQDKSVEVDALTDFPVHVEPDEGNLLGQVDVTTDTVTQSYTFTDPTTLEEGVTLDFSDKLVSSMTMSGTLEAVTINSDFTTLTPSEGYAGIKSVTDTRTPLPAPTASANQTYDRIVWSASGDVLSVGNESGVYFTNTYTTPIPWSVHNSTFDIDITAGVYSTASNVSYSRSYTNNMTTGKAILWSADQNDGLYYVRLLTPTQCVTAAPYFYQAYATQWIDMAPAICFDGTETTEVLDEFTKGYGMTPIPYIVNKRALKFHLNSGTDTYRGSYVGSLNYLQNVISTYGNLQANVIGLCSDSDYIAWNTGLLAGFSMHDLYIYDHMEYSPAGFCQNCSGLHHVFFRTTSAPSFVNGQPFYNCPNLEQIHVPSGQLSSYQNKLRDWPSLVSKLVEGGFFDL